MQTRDKIFEDLSRLMTNAAGVAQGAREEAETAMKSWIDRWLADRDFVTREEFDAVKAMAEKARAENEELRAITNIFGIFERAVIISSVIPSLKYSCSGSPLRLSKARTAIEGLSGSGRGGLSGSPDLRSAAI